jgi:hypothetical protein
LDAGDRHRTGAARAVEILVAGAERELARRGFLHDLGTGIVDDHLALTLGARWIRTDVECDLTAALTGSRRKPGDPAGLC